MVSSVILFWLSSVNIENNDEKNQTIKRTRGEISLGSSDGRANGPYGNRHWFKSQSHYASCINNNKKLA